MEKLLKILTDIAPEVDFYREEHLVEDGFLDSYDIITIVAELDGTLGIRLDAQDLTPENFNSARALYDLIRRKES